MRVWIRPVTGHGRPYGIPAGGSGVRRIRRRWAVWAAVAVEVLALGYGSASQAHPPTAMLSDQVATATSGWDTFRRLDALPYLSSQGETHQFSSFDRTGGWNRRVILGASPVRRGADPLTARPSGHQSTGSDGGVRTEASCASGSGQ